MQNINQYKLRYNTYSICGIILLPISVNGGINMTLAEKLIKEFEQLTEEKKKEVIDFVEFIKAKEQKELESLMNSVINDNREALEELAK